MRGYAQLGKPEQILQAGEYIRGKMTYVTSFIKAESKHCYLTNENNAGTKQTHAVKYLHN